MSELLDSPPFPEPLTSVDGVYNALRDLHRWVDDNRDELHKMLDKEVVPKVRRLPERKHYHNQPPVMITQHIFTIRGLREEWDSLVRTFEDVWDCAACLQGRASILQTAASLVNDAFTPLEVREARAQEALEALTNRLRRLSDFVDDVMEPRDEKRRT